MARNKRTTKQPETATERLTTLTAKREELRRLRFGGAGAGKTTNVRRIRVLRREIARLLGDWPRSENH